MHFNNDFCDISQNATLNSDVGLKEMRLISKIIPLKYTLLFDYSNIKNLLLIDNKVTNYDVFVNNTNSDTISIVYDHSSQSTELIEFLNNKFKTIDRLCFIFDEVCAKKNKNFINNEPFFMNSDLSEINFNKLTTNFKLVINLCNRFNIINVDFLACNSLNYQEWTKYYDQLNIFTRTIKSSFGSTIGASNNKTGNTQCGGDWVLESTGQDIKFIYFVDSICNYENVLGGSYTIGEPGDTINIRQNNNDIQYQINNDAWSTLDFLNNDYTIGQGASGAIIYVNFITDITVLTVNVYFICGISNINFDGQGYTMSFTNNVSSYPGLIQNGVGENNTAIGVYSNITVKNIIMNCTNSQIPPLLKSGGGWICQQYFGLDSIDSSTFKATCTVTNCSSDGLISFGGGGIIGGNAAAQVIDCNNSGEIGNNAGGIFGSGANLNSAGICMATNCYSTGNLNSSSGGIFGSHTNNNLTMNSLGLCVATNCYSTGSFLSGQIQTGGIFGSYAGLSYSAPCTATNCYSTGDIGFKGGGIFADGATNSTATNCYSTGQINSVDDVDDTRTGGIFGINASTCTATHCYTSGFGSLINGIFGWHTAPIDPDNPTNEHDGGYEKNGTNNYSETNHNTSGWNDFNANFSLNNNYGLNMTDGQNQIWIDPSIISATIPFLLASFNKNLYTQINATVYVNQLTNLQITPYATGQKWYVNNSPTIIINETGQMTSSSNGLYNNLYVINGSGDSLSTIFGYNIQNFLLNIINSPNFGSYNLSKLVNTTNKKHIKKIRKFINNL